MASIWALPCSMPCGIEYVGVGDPVGYCQQEIVDQHGLFLWADFQGSVALKAVQQGGGGLSFAQEQAAHGLVQVRDS